MVTHRDLSLLSGVSSEDLSTTHFKISTVYCNLRLINLKVLIHNHNQFPHLEVQCFEK
jgi:hypothetical protein